MKKSKNSKGTMRHELSPSRRDFMKKTGVLAATAAVIGVPVSLAGTKKEVSLPPKMKPVKIGLYGPSHCAAPAILAMIEGFFKNEGIQVEIINFPGKPLATKALVSGQVDFAQVNIPKLFEVHTSRTGTPLVVTAITGVNGSAIMSRWGFRIQDPQKDLKNKRLAAPSRLTVQYLVSRMFLERSGLRFKDVRHVFPKLPDLFPGFKNGIIDASIYPEPKNQIMRAKGIAHTYVLSKELWVDHPCCCLACTRNLFNKDDKLVIAASRAVTRAALEANRVGLRGDLVDKLRKTSQYKYNKIPKAILDEAFKAGQADFYPFPYQSSARVVLNLMDIYGVLKSNRDHKELAEEVFMSDLSRAIFADLGYDAPKSNYRAERVMGRVLTYS